MIWKHIAFSHIFGSVENAYINLYAVRQPTSLASEDNVLEIYDGLIKMSSENSLNLKTGVTRETD